MIFPAVISHEKMMQALDWAYEKSVNGIGGFDSAEELANSYQGKYDSTLKQANMLIRFQNTKSAFSGFVTGLGGIITLPVALPANITSVLLVQVRMIAAIAHLGGHDIRDDRVKTMVFSCLVANSAKEVLKDVGIALGNKLAMNAVKSVSGKTLQTINKRVGFRLLTKMGRTGAINLSKVVPIAGGLISGSIDAFTTNKIGNVARNVFIDSDEVEGSTAAAAAE